MENIKTKILANKVTLGLIAAILILVIGGFALFKGLTVQKQSAQLQEVELNFDAEGPYALLLPRRDGNALILNIKRVSSYEEISYELSYSSKVDNAGAVSEEGEESTGSIDRGVQGTINTDDKKNEYSQEILFGTCSKGDTMSPLHCVFDKGVENGTLILRIKQGNIIYKMTTTWHLQQPDVALGKISSGDGNFIYTTTESRENLNLVGYTIVNDLTGVPKIPDGKQVFGKVYALNVPPTRAMVKGDLSLELAENPPANAKIARFNETKNDWEMLDTKVDGGRVSASSPSGGIFAVLVDASK